MKFTCTKENLNHTLALVGGLAGRQTNLPILSNILISAGDSKVDFVTTNLEIAVKTGLRAKIEQKGEFTVPAKTLADYVNLLPDEQITMELKNNEMLVRCGNSSTKIKGAPADDYPVIPEIEEQHSYVILVDNFKSSLGEVVVAAAKNEIRPELSGVYFSFFKDDAANLTLAATDSYRLAEKKIKVDQGKDEFDCIVPGRTVYELIRLLALSKNKETETKVRLWVSENQLAIRYDNFEMSSRLIEGKYPDYNQIIPKEFKTSALVPAGVMINKIKAASLFTTIGVNAVAFDLNASDKTVGISSTSTQTGEHSSRIDAQMQGEENSILLNHRYVLDGLQQMEDEVEFKVNSAEAPCLLRPKNKQDYLYIVMPIRQ